MRSAKTTNPELIELITLLKKEGRERKASIWIDVASHLSKPRRQRVAVNLSSINRNTKRAETVVIPGKVLGVGSLTHSVTIAAFDVSGKAMEKIGSAKAKYISIPELVQRNPVGSNVKIMW